MPSDPAAAHATEQDARVNHTPLALHVTSRDSSSCRGGALESSLNQEQIGRVFSYIYIYIDIDIDIDIDMCVFIIYIYIYMYVYICVCMCG